MASNIAGDLLTENILLLRISWRQAKLSPLGVHAMGIEIKQTICGHMLLILLNIVPVETQCWKE